MKHNPIPMSDQEVFELRIIHRLDKIQESLDKSKIRLDKIAEKVNRIEADIFVKSIPLPQEDRQKILANMLRKALEDDQP